MTLFEQAQQELRLLESHWLSVLSWLGAKLGRSPDELLSRWNPDQYLEADRKLRHEMRLPQRRNVGWTVLHFLDFGRYSELAGSYANELNDLGSPPRNWRAVLAKHQQDGIIGYRNHCQHSNRFAMLSRDEQEAAVRLLREERACLEKWWPDCPVNLRAPPRETDLRAALRLIGPNPDDLAPFAAELAMRPIPSARNLLHGAKSDFVKYLEGDLDALYEVADKEIGKGRASLYLACVREWPLRSAERDRVRRRVAKALRDRGAEAARIIILVDGAELEKSSSVDRNDIELVLPRVRAGSGVGIVRTLISRDAPTRHHIDLLDSLRVTGAASIPEISRTWIDAFSVENVTTRFYTEFRELRDRLIIEAQTSNPDIEELQGDPDKDLDLHAFGTRQLSRVLFLWFLQQKRWLGDSPGGGRVNFLVEEFARHGGGSDTFFSDVLVPIIFDGIGKRTGPAHKAAIERFGFLPYLGGGIFTPGANEFEQRLFQFDDEGIATRTVKLPDDLFDPRKDEAEASGGRRGRRTRTILGLLRGYRFTTQESTPDDQSLDPDPELLGKVFENLYQGDERHRTGAYYTPREIVQFMCRRTLDAYLREQTGVPQETLDWLRHEAEDPTLSDRKLPSTESDELIVALERVRICDPAVGSGAFLLMMMHEIVTLRRGIDESDDRPVAKDSIDVAGWKSRVATNSLYGVDINPMAVEICHLRLWLSIIVDLDAHSSRDIPALPNLDFRIVAGDSLIDRMGEEPFFESIPPPDPDKTDIFLHGQVIGLQKDLDALKDRFRLSEGAAEKDVKRQRELRHKIREKQVEIARVQVDYALDGPDGARVRLAALEKPRSRTAKPTARQLHAARVRVAHLKDVGSGLRPSAPYQKPFLWPVNFHDVFEADRSGFDIVVANPPYVRMEGIDNTDESTYAHAFPEVVGPRADLLVYFYARAVQILRDGGQLAFITSNSFVKRAYGENLRSFLVNNVCIDTVIDFGETAIFDATVEPYVLTGRKGTPAEDHWLDGHFLFVEIARRVGRRGSVAQVREQLGFLAELMEADIVHLLQRTFGENGWKIEKPEVIALYRRTMAQGTPVGAFAQGHTYYCIKTGLDAAFVINEEKRAELLASDTRSNELIKPWLRGRDIKRWRPAWAGLYVIFTRRGTNIAEYPAIKSHLEAYRPRLERRATAHLHPWFELQQPQEGCYQEFENEKILWPEFARSVRFCHAAAGVMANNKCYFWPNAPRWTLALLNSELIEFLLCQITGEIRGGFMQLYDHFVRRLPIVEAEPKMASTLTALAEKMMLDPTNADTERLIEQHVRHLYGLTAADSRIVDDWFAKRSLAVDEDGTLSDGDD